MRAKSLIVADITAASFATAATIVGGPIYVGHLKSFDSYVFTTGNSATTASVAIIYEAAPFKDGVWVAITSTSLNTAANATSVTVRNLFKDNDSPWFRIKLSTTATGGYATSAVRIVMTSIQED